MNRLIVILSTFLISLHGYGQAELNDFLNGQVSGNRIFLEIDYAGMLDSIDVLNAALSSDETAEWGVYTYLNTDVVGEQAGDESGWSVALSNDGQILAVGAMKNDGAGNNAGHVRVYQWDAANASWLQLGEDIDGRVKVMALVEVLPFRLTGQYWQLVQMAMTHMRLTQVKPRCLGGILEHGSKWVRIFTVS